MNADYSKEHVFSKEELEQADEVIEMVEFATLHIPNAALRSRGIQESESSDGKQFWYYLSVRPSQYPAYKKAYECGELVNLNNYGELLACDWGSFPPDHIIQRMADKHGCEIGFENELLMHIQSYNNGDNKHDDL